jgi:hypothetical protein
MRATLLAASALLAGVALGRWSVPDAPPPEPMAMAPAAVAPPLAVLAPINLAQARCEPEPDDDTVAREAPPGDDKAATLSTALDTLARTADPQQKTALIREITALKAQDDLRTAFGWLTQHRSDPAYAESARNLLYQWSYARPEHVAALLPEVASGEAQAAAAQQLAQFWNKKDPHAYHAWVASLPEGALKAAAGAPY